MIANLATGVKPAQPRTRVGAVVAFAHLVRGTVGVEDALGSAGRRRPDHAGKARAVAASSRISGRLAVRAAGVGNTGINSHNRCGG